MKQTIIICFLIVGLFEATEVFSQKGTWSQDSLAFYEKNFWTEVKARDEEKANKTVKHITAEGSAELDPMLFDFFTTALKKSDEIYFPRILGKLEAGLGTMEYFKGDLTAAKKAFRRAKLIYSNAKMLEETAGMAMNIGVMQEKGGYFDSAILNYQETLPIFESEEDILSVASVNENIGLAYIKQSKFQKALDYFSITDSLLTTILDSLENRWIGFYRNKYMALSGLNRQNEGLQVLLRALKIAEHNKNKLSIGKINDQLSDVYKFMGDFQKQYEALLTSKAILIDTQDLFGIANLYSSLLAYHSESGNLDSARFYAKKSLEFFEPNGFIESTGNIYGSLGNIEFKEGKYNEAIIYFKKALDTYEFQNNRDGAGFLFNLGFAYNKLGDYKSALNFIEQSLTIRKELNLPADLQESYQGLAETYQRMGDYKKAFENLTLYQVYKDSVFTETKNKQLAELKEQFESEKKDKAIADLEQEREFQNLLTQKQQAQIYFGIGGLVLLLGMSGVFFRQATLRKKHNQELEIKNEEIAKQSAERELLLKEIHHRVKNNLQIISSLLSMQTRSLKDDKMKDVMKESQSRVKTMALIHEKLYQYENLSKINIQEYMLQLSDFLTQTYRSEKDIKITIDAEDINLDMDMAVPLGLITNELLSNSLKYAFEDRAFGEINISFSQKENGFFKLSIKDNGIGLDDKLDIDSAKSLGLKLVKTLTRQINGQLRIIHHPGATFEIEFSEQRIAA